MNQQIHEDDESFTINDNETLLSFEDGTELTIIDESIFLALL
jgi:hypothetical protein